MSTLDRDFASAGEEDYLEMAVRSPTDTSEDSVEVKVCPISPRNKRKGTEPRKVQDLFAGPLKKRVCLQVKADTQSRPFRPWSEGVVEPKHNSFRPPTPVYQEQPVPLVKKRDPPSEVQPRVPMHPHLQKLSSVETDRMLMASAEAFPKLQAARKEQRNYKNMTRERRIEANARERTRVHTISAAFDTLRRSVPSYSHNQKLSKLSVLRIACSYIMTLSSMVDGDEKGPGTSECVEMVTRTIQREGKLRKKKDDE